MKNLILDTLTIASYFCSMDSANTIWPADDDDSALIREVYARYGLAMYTAQVLEHGIVNSLLVLKHLPSFSMNEGTQAWETAYDYSFDTEFAKTFGNLVKALSEVDIVPRSIVDCLRVAKKTRDALAHRFFRDHDLQFLTQAGRVEMIGFCENAVAEFQNVDKELEDFCAPYRLKFGITEEKTELIYREMLEQAGVSVFKT